ncbi:hypothetical protein JTE90_024749 [Oedothorax gibbosus]|uniref:Uncharacterized protein n=1 Tax=Oedothorax gibbosus TaxID=931172 RepID=A0AAV6UBJ5_9ARAC|nr:hypothetical protein JTE90_024749 [Oedothorax gibbosus]
MTIELSGEKYPTLSMVIPLLRGLQHTIKNRSRKAATPYYYSWVSRSQSAKDPHFKKTAFGVEENSKKAETSVKSELQRMLSKNKSSSADDCFRKLG